MIQWHKIRIVFYKENCTLKIINPNPVSVKVELKATLANLSKGPGYSVTLLGTREYSIELPPGGQSLVPVRGAQLATLIITYTLPGGRESRIAYNVQCNK